MDDKKLEDLKNLNVPEPGQGARNRALDASLLAFEQNKKQQNSGIKNIFQGFDWRERLTSMLPPLTWSWTMKHRAIVGTLIAGVILIPLTAQLMNTTGQVPVSSLGKEVKPIKPLPNGRVETDAKIAENKPDAPKKRPLRTVAEALKAEVPAVADQAAPVAAPPPAVLGRVKRSHGYSSQRLAKTKSYESRRQRFDDRIARPQPTSRDKFEKFSNNVVKSVAQNPVSTFSIDVDTASYSFVRRTLEAGRLPQANAVRVEEMINYFSYNYPAADDATKPFKPTIAVYPTPWNVNTKLLHIGLKGHTIVPANKPASNLVFLIDVSGSMHSRDKLPLLKSAFRLLVNQLGADDTVSIVTYAGRAGTVLEPTKVSDKHKILAALENLRSGGSTAGAKGIRQAYALAERSFKKKGVNRVILATDGDFNVGITGRDKLKAYIAEKRKSGVFLSVLGFGRGNYNDALMQTLAQNGNGTAAYIDTLKEAHKVLVTEAHSTLFTIAKDVKIQVEFNPAKISSYRLVGYETRHLNRADFNNDKVDAGDIGSGHTVTAIYEITLADAKSKQIDDLRYRANTPAAKPAADTGNEYAHLKLRYKLPGKDTSTLMSVPITTDMEVSDTKQLSGDFQFGASVAAFAQKLRGVSHLSDHSYDRILELAKRGRGEDVYGYRSEFMSLVRLAKSLSVQSAKPKK